MDTFIFQYSIYNFVQSEVNYLCHYAGALRAKLYFKNNKELVWDGGR